MPFSMLGEAVIPMGTTDYRGEKMLPLGGIDCFVGFTAPVEAGAVQHQDDRSLGVSPHARGSQSPP
jgi:hypothetical protein